MIELLRESIEKNSKQFLRLRSNQITEEGDTLAQAAAVFKVRSLAGENAPGQPAT